MFPGEKSHRFAIQTRNWTAICSNWVQYCRICWVVQPRWWNYAHDRHQVPAQLISRNTKRDDKTLETHVFLANDTQLSHGECSENFLIANNSSSSTVDSLSTFCNPTLGFIVISVPEAIWCWQNAGSLTDRTLLTWLPDVLSTVFEIPRSKLDIGIHPCLVSTVCWGLSQLQFRRLTACETKPVDFSMKAGLGDLWEEHHDIAISE